MPEHSRAHARAWAEAGFSVIVVLNTDRLSDGLQSQDLDFASGVLLRENRGYDFGAWATALQQVPSIRSARLLALANDSMLGPFDTFRPMLNRVRMINADVVGVTESLEFGRHFQSFLIFFRPAALQSKAFWKFWTHVRAAGRIVAVYRYELGLIKVLEQAGLRCAALFKSEDVHNPTLTRWRELIDEGLPYLKISLLRHNVFGADISGWQDALVDHGYDPALAKSISARHKQSPRR